MSVRVHPAWVIAARGVLALVLLWAAVPKLLDPGAFVTDVENYRLLPAELAPLFAALLPAFELVAGLALLTRFTQRGAAVLAALMLAAFAVAMAQARMRGIDLRCGCFGAALEGEVSWLTVTRSAGLAVLALFVVLASGASDKRAGRAVDSDAETASDP